MTRRSAKGSAQDRRIRGDSRPVNASERRETGRGRHSAHDDLCQSVQEHLQARGFRVWRLWAPGYRRISAGVPDVLARRLGREVWVECKTGRDSLSEAQEEFMLYEIPGVEHYEVRFETLDAFLEDMDQEAAR